MAHHQSLVRVATGVLPVAFVVVWSSGYLAGSIGAHSGPPLALLFWRFLLAFVVLGAVALVTWAPWPSRPSAYVHLVVAGVLLPLTAPAIGSSVWLALVNSIGGFTMLFLLLRVRSGGAATSLLYLVPPVTAVLALLVLGQSTPLTVFVGMAVSGAGVLLVVFARRRARCA